MDVFIDSRNGPLARAEVRRALLHGTDVEGLVRYIARGNGRAIATVTLPEDFGFNPGLRPYAFDPAKAKALLTEAGYPDGFRLQGLATHDTQTLATALAQQWAKIGVKLDLAVEGRVARDVPVDQGARPTRLPDPGSHEHHLRRGVPAAPPPRSDASDGPRVEPARPRSPEPGRQRAGLRGPRRAPPRAPDDRVRAGSHHPALPGRGPLRGAGPRDRLRAVRRHDPASRGSRAAADDDRNRGAESGAAEAAAAARPRLAANGMAAGAVRHRHQADPGGDPARPPAARERSPTSGTPARRPRWSSRSARSFRCGCVRWRFA